MMMGSSSSRNSIRTAHEELLHYAQNKHEMEDKIHRLERAADSYAKQAEAHRAAVADHDKTLAKLEAHELNVKARESKLEQMKAELDSQRTRQLAHQEALHNQEADQQERETSLAGLIKDAQQKMASLHQRSTDLDNFEKGLKIREQAIANREEKIKGLIRAL